MYKKIDEIICVSEQSRQKFQPLYSEYKTKCKANYNLIDKEQIVNLSSENPEFIFKKNCIVAIGRLIRVKRFDILIKAYKFILEEGIDSHLLILGEL